MRHPDLVGGFNRLDSTILKACGGQVLAKEGADGLLGLAIVHPDFPDGLGVVIKIAHGWNPHATWYVARAALGVLGFELRNPYPLHRQKAFLVPGVVPRRHLAALEQIPTWDEWDPDRDRWYYDWKKRGWRGRRRAACGHERRDVGKEPVRLSRRWDVSRLFWQWFVFLSLLGSMAFALAIVLLFPARAKSEVALSTAA